jgi:hypothetical protein
MMNDQVMESLRTHYGVEPPRGAKERVWARLQQRRARTMTLRWALVGAGGLAAVAALVALRPGPPRPAHAVVVQSLGSVALVSGEHRASGSVDTPIGDDAWVETADGQILVGVRHDYLLWAVENSRFRIERGDRDVVVHLDRGQVHVWSARRTDGALSVVTPKHRGVVVGTVFSVVYADGGERFAVARGKVDVYDEQMRIAHLSAGEAWAAGLEAEGVSDHVVSLLERAASGRDVRLSHATPGAAAAATVPRQVDGTGPPAAAVTTTARERDAGPPAGRRSRRVASPSRSSVATAEASPVASPPAESEADRLAREAESFERAGQYRPASDRYERLARGTGIDAEWALYRLGKLRDRHLGDRPGALSAWREHRRRFPAGSLRQEVDLSIVEVLVRLGKNQEALAEADRFLSRYPTSERRAELAGIKERLTP